jgi:hypothetical protein
MVVARVKAASQFLQTKRSPGGVYIGENTRRVEGGLPNRSYLDLKLDSLISLGFLQRGSQPRSLRIKTVWRGGIRLGHDSARVHNSSNLWAARHSSAQSGDDVMDCTDGWRCGSAAGI